MSEKNLNHGTIDNLSEGHNQNPNSSTKISEAEATDVVGGYVGGSRSWTEKGAVLDLSQAEYNALKNGNFFDRYGRLPRAKFIAAMGFLDKQGFKGTHHITPGGRKPDPMDKFRDPDAYNFVTIKVHD